MKPLLIDEVKQALRAKLKTELKKGLITGVRTDSRQVKAGELFVALRGEHFDGHEFLEQAIANGARAIVVDRNVPVPPSAKNGMVSILKVDDCVEALGSLARFYRRQLLRSVRVIAVTGSNGKTTTREMIYHTLSKYKKGHRSPHNFNNAVGVPLTLFGIEPDHEFVVVEIGTNSRGEVGALSRIVEPDVAVITHVGPTHLEGLGDIDGVSVEKVSIVAGLRDHGVVVCGMEHEGTLERLQALGQPLITFGVNPAADVCAQKVVWEQGRLSFETNDGCPVHLPMGGVHNVKNALAALAVSRRLGLTNQQVAYALADFAAVQGRMHYHNVNNIVIIDDSYNANPASMDAALTELCQHRQAGRRILVCGDMCELGDASEAYHRALGEKVASASVDLLLTVGPQAALTASAALESGMGKSRVQRAVSSKRLARLIKSMIRDEDVILVKGSRAMELEQVVEALKRYRGGRPRVARMGVGQSVPHAPAARKVKLQV